LEQDYLSTEGVLIANANSADASGVAVSARYPAGYEPYLLYGSETIPSPTGNKVVAKSDSCYLPKTIINGCSFKKGDEGLAFYINDPKNAFDWRIVWAGCGGQTLGGMRIPGSNGASSNNQNPREPEPPFDDWFTGSVGDPHTSLKEYKGNHSYSAMREFAECHLLPASPALVV